MRLRFSNTRFDENLFQLLLPLKDAWRNGFVETPYSFASQLLFERAFNELLFCKSMFIIIDDDFQLGQSFLSLPAVRECTLLRILHPPSPLAVAEILGWLNADGRSAESKLLEMCDDELGDSVDNLVQRLKTVSSGSGQILFRV